MILKFNEYINLFEGVGASVKLSSLIKILKPFGWEYVRAKGGDSFKFIKGKHTVCGHLEHGNAKDENRLIDVNTIDQIRTYMIEDFYETGDLTAIKNIDWKRLGHKDPLSRELKNIDPETGKEREKELNIGQKLNKIRNEKSIDKANTLYKDCVLFRIDYSDENSAYIIMNYDDKGYEKYNICKSETDRRPLLKNWMDAYKEIDGEYYLGKINWNANSIKVSYKKVLSDGSLDNRVAFKLEESRKM